MKRKIDVGEDFPLDAEVIVAKTEHDEAKTRGKIALLVVCFVGLSVMVTFFFGCFDGSFNELNALWIAGGPIIGALINWYFGRKNE